MQPTNRVTAQGERSRTALGTHPAIWFQTILITPITLHPLLKSLFKNYSFRSVALEPLFSNLRLSLWG